MYKEKTADCTDSFVLQPRPSKRLSSHEAYRVHHTPSPGPRETTVWCHVMTLSALLWW